MITPPEPTEYQSYYGRYISLVPGRDLTQTLNSQLAQSLPILSAIDEQKSLYRYASGKWSIKEVLGHLIDAERIFTYRALRFARRDSTPLPGFDQDPYVAAANFDSRPWRRLHRGIRTRSPVHHFVLSRLSAGRCAAIRHSQSKLHHRARPGLHNRRPRAASHGDSPRTLPVNALQGQAASQTSNDNVITC